MKKNVRFLLFFLAWCTAPSLWAQPIAGGIEYQAIARDASGRPLPNMQVTVQAALRPEVQNSEVFYAETHEVQTDARGLFSIVIGEGRTAKGTFAQIPWAKEQVWLDISARNQTNAPFQIISSSRLPAVPYAMHAAATSRIPSAEEPTEKNQSIYWTTSGNSLTVPETQFFGSRDNQDVIFKTNATTRVKVSKEGQMKIFSGVDGPDNALNSYPMTVGGSNQGIYIKVNGSRNNDNNFVNFGDDVEFTWGTIEGETWSELTSGWEYQLQVALYALQATALTASLVNWAAAAAGEFASGLGAGAGAAIILDLAGLAVDLANLLQESITWGINIANDIGVSFSSGAGDYAEWLERADDSRKLLPGELVGVSGGKVSLNTDNADHLMVVSTLPAVLGNMPQAKDKHRFEKIAFMGQVPVRVLGPVAAGDYILPSGSNDGFAIAVHPDQMKIGDYARIVGVAWESGKTYAPFQMVKVAVGINANDLSREVVVLEKRVEAVVAFLKGQSPSFLPDGAPANPTAYLTKAAPLPQDKTFSDEEFNQILDANAPLFNDLMAQTKAELLRRGNDLDQFPQLRAFLDNPVPVMKELRSNPAFLPQWAQWDKAVRDGQRK